MPPTEILPDSSRVAMGTAPRLTAELFSIPLEPGRWLIYAPLRAAAFVANAPTVNLLASLRQGTYDHANDPDGAVLEFLRRIEIVDSGPEQSPITRFDGEPEPTSVTLFLTTACNLRCTYCYASAGDTAVKNMPLSVAKRGIDFVIANALRRGVEAIQVGYHGGGEPTVNWRVLTGSLEYAKERAAGNGLMVHAGTATNGLLSDEQIDWIIANLDDVSLSFDGLPEMHDRHRPTASGQGSSDRVMHTLRRLDAANHRYGLRMTVTADQISRLADSVEFVCREFHPRRIQVEPSYQLGRWKGAPSAETEEFVAAYREAHGRARALAKDIYFSGARLGVLSNHFCGVTQDTFALSPDGNVTACYEAFSEQNEYASTFFYGKPSEAGSYSFDLARLDHLRKQAVQHREYCQGCFAKWSCGGDCYHKALHANGGKEFKGTERCHVIRELTKDQILDRIARAGGWFWHGLPAEAGSCTETTQGEQP